MSITEQYLHYHNKYKKQYGIKSLVLMQVGSFYEMYATETDGPNLKEIGDLINTVCTRKDKSIKEVSLSNPYLVGFPMVATEKFVSILIRNGYTLIMVDQVTDPPEPKREVTNIYSPSTYIGSTNVVDTNYATCIYVEYEKQKNNSELLCVGLSSIDISTGKVLIDEGISTCIDINLGFDTITRFLTVSNPKEIFLVINGDGKYSDKDIISKLEVDERIVKIKKFDEKYLKINYQNEYLSNIYRNKLNISIIEHLDLEKLNYARVSLIMLIDFIRNYSAKLIEGLSEPEIKIDCKHMILGNNAAYQMSIIDNDSYNYMNGIKFKSLYDVVNNAQTGMGKRFIKTILLNPLIDSKKINEYYNLTEEINLKGVQDKYKNLLRNIIDIEKFKRRMNMNLLQPFELNEFNDTIYNIVEIINTVQKDEISIKFNKDLKKNCEKFNNEIKKIFNQNELKKNTLDIKSNLFNKNINEDIDKLAKAYLSEHNFLNDIKIQFDKILLSLQKKKSDIEFTKISSTPSEGYFITISKIRFDVLKKHYKKTNDKIKTDTDDINFDNLKIKELKTAVKIFVENQNEYDINEVETKLLKIVKEQYLYNIKYIHNEYQNFFIELISFITKLDYVNSNAITSKLYNYVKPKLSTSKTNFIKASKLRHPIVERIIDYEYVPHNINLNDELNGMLIYGLNSSGKSVLMKGIGLNLIMAQCGMFVSCENFEYTIYNSIYTRITGNDNIFRGQSSFTLEMTELNTILKRADTKTLIIGDEICRGTENISGNAIVASTIIHLAKIKSTFIFTTHLHELIQLNKIRELKNVKAFHLSVDYDSKNDILIYDRILKEGSGDKVYGVLVAKYIIDDKEFIENTLEIKNELTNSFSSMISGKKSRYNSDIFVYKCENCGRSAENGEMEFLQTHHINFQSKCKDGFSVEKPHIKTNSPANLVVICEKCHNDLHLNKIDIKGKVLSSKGKIIKK
jgi:DNA mismatch repair protein MutS